MECGKKTAAHLDLMPQIGEKIGTHKKMSPSKFECSLVESATAVAICFFIFIGAFLSVVLFAVSVDERNCCHEMECCVTNSSIKRCSGSTKWSVYDGYQPSWSVRLTVPGVDACTANESQVIYDEADDICYIKKQTAQSTLAQHPDGGPSEPCHVCNCDRVYITSNVMWSVTEDSSARTVFIVFMVLLALSIIIVVVTWCKSYALFKSMKARRPINEGDSLIHNSDI